MASPLFANLALSALDEPFDAAWRATSKYRNQRTYLRSKGQATYKLIRYSDDFVILVAGTREQAEALRERAAQILAAQGLRLSASKTLITHVDQGFDFLGVRIQRRPRRGKSPCAYTFMSKPAFQTAKRKIKALTRRHTRNFSLRELLVMVNRILRGVANYFRFAAGKRTLHYLGYYAWWRVMRWLRAKHPKVTWTWFRKRYFGKDKLAEAGVTLFRPDSVKVAPYRYRGTKIATPWKHRADGNHPCRLPARHRRAGGPGVAARSPVRMTATGMPVESPVPGQPARRVRRCGAGKRGGNAGTAPHLDPTPARQLWVSAQTLGPSGP